MAVINWGIIGCGDVTEIKSGPAFNKVPQSNLVAVMRRDATKAADYAKRHNVSKWYTDASLLINDPEVNAIYIATPPLQHEEYTIMAMAAGKPVYVEKPMAINSEAAKRMVEASKKFNVKLCVAHYRREQPLFHKIKSLLAKKIIGDVIFVNLQFLQSKITSSIPNAQYNWRVDPKISGGGLFHDLAPHQLDLMLYYFGEIFDASGFSINQNLTQDVDTLVNGQIKFKNGIFFNGTWCFTIAKGDETDVCQIHGSLGSISFPMFGHKITLTLNGVSEDFDFLPLEHVEQPMIAKVVAYFLGNSDNPCSGEDGLKTMELIDIFTSKNK